jgi:DNA invertase Pin-like site-specific DNA recombinase
MYNQYKSKPKKEKKGKAKTMSEKFGYVRVSTINQIEALNVQKDALQKQGITRIIEDISSGANFDRPGLKSLLSVIQSDDSIYVWKLDRLGRSLKELVSLMENLATKKINVISLTESIDTSTPAGKLITNLFLVLAEFERNLLKERVNAGIASARARGRNGGRPDSLDEAKKKAVIILHKNGTPIKEILKVYDISKSTLYNYIAEEQAKNEKT